LRPSVEAAPSSFDSPSETCARAGLRTTTAYAAPPSGSSHEVSVPFSALSRSNRRLPIAGALPSRPFSDPQGFPPRPALHPSDRRRPLAAHALRVLPSEPCSSRATCVARRRASPARSWASETAVASGLPRGLTLQGVSRSGIRVASAPRGACDRCSLGFSMTSAVLPSLPRTRRPPLTALGGVTRPALSVSQQTPWRFPPKWEPTTLVFLALPRVAPEVLAELRRVRRELNPRPNKVLPCFLHA